MRKTKIKREMPHKELTGNRFKSDRHTKIGQEIQFKIESPDGQIQNVPTILKDKIVYPVNICPHCESKATFHRTIQEDGDIVGNVWRINRSINPNGFIIKKFDYCLDCHKEFLFELYVWVKKEEKKE